MAEAIAVNQEQDACNQFKSSLLDTHSAWRPVFSMAAADQSVSFPMLFVVACVMYCLHYLLVHTLAVDEKQYKRQDRAGKGKDEGSNDHTPVRADVPGNIQREISDIRFRPSMRIGSCIIDRVEQLRALIIDGSSDDRTSVHENVLRHAQSSHVMIVNELTMAYTVSCGNLEVTHDPGSSL